MIIGRSSAFCSPDPYAPRPFQIFYAGRIEVAKGVFDLFESFRNLVAEGKEVELDYCGDGAALPSLREAILEFGLSERVRIHGHLNRPELFDLLALAQVVVVPTRSSFPEGLNQVVIEAVLAKRPVVTSAVCPAIDLVMSAVVEAKPDEVESYTVALKLLMDDREVFEQKILAASHLGVEFFDVNKGWTAKAFEMIAEEYSSAPLQRKIRSEVKLPENRPKSHRLHKRVLRRLDRREHSPPMESPSQFKSSDFSLV